MTPNLNTLITLAKGAGEILRAGYSQAKEIRHKGTVDLVTQFDHQSEDYLVGEIRRQFPQDTIVTEESGLLSGSGGGRWYLDPLDGTVNFAHGVPMFAVSIAYEEAGQMKYGVVYEPLRDECFCAEAGKGATLNGEPIQVSSAPDLIHSLMVTGFPYDLLDTPKNNLDNFVRFSRLLPGRAPAGFGGAGPVLRGLRPAGWLLGDPPERLGYCGRQPDRTRGGRGDDRPGGRSAGDESAFFGAGRQPGHPSADAGPAAR